MLRPGAPQQQGAAGDRSRGHIGGRFDAVGDHLVPAAVQRFHPLDGDHPVLFDGNTRPAGVEIPAQILDLRLPGRIMQHGGSIGGGCRKQHVLGCPHAGQGQGNFRPLQPPLGAAAQMPPLLLDGDAQLFQGVQVQVDGPGAQLTPAGEGHARLPAFGDNRP